MENIYKLVMVDNGTTVVIQMKKDWRFVHVTYDLFIPPLGKQFLKVIS